VSAGTPEGGRRSEVAERLLRELRLAEDQERAAEQRHDAERMAETEAAYAWRRRRATAARRDYHRFVREFSRLDR
jgi:hypothetical protein